MNSSLPNTLHFIFFFFRNRPKILRQSAMPQLNWFFKKKLRGLEKKVKHRENVALRRTKKA